ncbi:MAG: hypothetical protein GY805_24245 [Chloroflexi bacterium]|nr:hypothetical protein [Chloroflexota bacterium]
MSKHLSRVVITDEMADQLQAYTESSIISPAEAAVIRQALAEFLERNGYPVENIHPPRGGDRSRK